jgi:aryl-phospho-beta-D-glucosidase BglC (GH1 family)
VTYCWPGINTVRIPIGYWIMEADNEDLPFAPGSARYLDDAFDMAATYNIRVVVSVHSARGSQNGFDHSAPRDRCVALLRISV